MHPVKTNTTSGTIHSHAGGHKHGSTIRFTVAGLIALCVSLITASLAASRFLDHRADRTGGKSAETPGPADAAPAAETDAPWGDLITLDVDIQQPEEYVSFDTTGGEQTRWVFSGLSQGQVRDKLEDCGMSDTQIAAALGAGRVTSRADATVLQPPAELVLSLKPEIRAKLYGTLSNWPENKFMHEPYHLPGNFAETAAGSGVSAQVVGLVSKLTYQSCGLSFFSDSELVLAGIADKEERLRLLKALTYQTAVLARLRLTKDSDIDKIIGYWGTTPGVRAKDLRPLLESVARTPEGSSISLLYLLPQFARERLYTFPLPTQAGDTRMDCHWTALNFLNATPDDRLQDTAYASEYIKQRFYQIGKPSMCGDIIFLLDSKGGVIHSAVHIADDIVFTKNGVNYAQPWILMRRQNLLDVYTRTEAPKVLYYRRKES